MTDTYGEPLPGRYRGPGSHPIPSGSTQGEEPIALTEMLVAKRLLLTGGGLLSQREAALETFLAYWIGSPSVLTDLPPCLPNGDV